MALIKKQLLAKEDMLLSADNTPMSQARAGTTVSVHPVNASVIPFDETRSISEAIQGLTYTHPLTHPVSIIDGSSNPSKFVKTDSLGNTGFDTVAWADIEGKPSTYTPSSHEHSLDEVTSGSLAASRIIVSETRQFITTEQATQLLEMEVKSNKGIPNGYAPLDSNGKINSSFLSYLNLVEVFTPVDLASMLALTSAQPGDIAYRQDNSTSYMLAALPSSTEANWKSLNTGSQIISVNDQTGIVSLNTSNIAEVTNLYFTNERVDDRVAALLQAGTNITLAYNDMLNTLTINANDTSVNWSEIQSKPVTLSGYGITNAYTKTESDAVSSLKANLASPTLTGTPRAPTVAVGTNTTQLATTAFVQAEIANDTYSKADVDSKVVHKTGNETIAGVKIFSDNVGIGVTPSAWYNLDVYTKAIDIGGCVDNGAIWSSLNMNHSHIGIGANFYYNNSLIPTYKGSYTASQYTQINGGHAWATAPSGTAGNPITWTNAMTLGSNGNLLVGTTTDDGVDKLQVNGSVTSKSSQYKYFDLNNAIYGCETTTVNNSCANIPINDYGYVTTVNNDAAYGMQTFVCFNGPARMFVRVRTGGFWSAWVEK